MEQERYAEYLLYLYALGGHQYADCPEIEALIQDTLVALIVKERRGEAIDHPKGFLATVLRNKHNDWLRHAYRNAVVTYEIPDVAAVYSSL